MNRLAQSLSPYLLQHQHNPVDWFPWCDEAFELARQHDKPIFLSVGYAACHWCHVMERESFENHQTAAVLNEHFVSIKVDREERPDIDQIYMNAVQVMTGHGGWPMSVFLNHDRQPFFAGTYWPPQQRFGMPGFMQVLDAIADAWKERRGEVNQHAGQIAEALKQLAHGGVDPSSEMIDDASVVDEAVGRLMRVLDPVYGGFGGAPKFPHATDLELLLRYSVTRDRSDCLDAVELTLDRMAAGGIRDHIGGGFARYSVDAKWLVPHFEKMLYDNALLAQVYLRAFQVTGHDRHAKVVRETLDYLCREMVDPDGGFHCSEDADSEGVEGKFYVWTPDQVAEVLGAERAERFCAIYDITRHGNFEGHNIPNLPVSIDEWGAKLGVAIDELQSQLAGDREKLRQARDERQHPGRDDKVLTAWNALAIRSLAASGAILDEPRYVEAAQRAAKFIFARMARTDGRLLHVFRAGRAHQDAFLDDYAYMIEACLTLFEATGETTWVMHATQLADMLLAHFQDSVNGGFYYTAQDAEMLIARTKDWHDGSLISGNASAASGLLALSRLTDRDDYRQAVARTLMVAGDILQQQSAACAGLLAVLDSFRSEPCPQVVVAVPDENEQRRVRSRFLRTYRPLVSRCWVVATQDQGSALIELTRDRIPIDGRLTVYLCHDFRCELPLVGKDAESWLDAGKSI